MKTKIIVIVTVAILTCGTAVLAVLNRQNSEPADANSFIITVGGQSYEVTRGLMEEIGITAIEVKKSTSKSPSAPVSLEGVPLKSVLDRLGIDIRDKESCVSRASDGFSAVISTVEALDPENAFIVAAQNGEPLKPLMDGGVGPFLLVIRKDPFANRWCRGLIELIFD